MTDIILKDNFLKKVYYLARHTDISLEELADQLGLSRGTLLPWETGNPILTLDMAVILAEYYGVSIDYLVGRTNNPKINK